MKKIILGTVFGLTLIGLAGVAYNANTPIKTYYPNGTLKSEVNQKFFQKNGIYKEYDETNRLKLEVPYQNDVKSGIQKEYFKNGARLEIPFSGGQKDGTAHFYTPENRIYSWNYKNNELTGTFNLHGGITGSFLPGNRFELISESNPKALVKGSVVCDTSVFEEAFSKTKETEQAYVFSKCISIEHFKISYPDIDAVFNGAYRFPHFTKKSVLDMTDKSGKIAEAYKTIAEMGSLDKESTKFLQSLIVTKTRVTFEDDNHHIKFEGLRDTGNPLSQAHFDLYDIAKLTEGSMQAAEKNQITPELFEIFKNISLTETTIYNVNNKPEMQFKGNFKPLLAQFSKDSAFHLYNLSEQKIMDVSGVESGIHIASAYPQTAQNMISFDIITDLAFLEEIQARLKNVKSPNEYQGFLIELLLSMPLKAPQTIQIKNLKINEPDGRTVMATQALSVNWFKQQITGEMVVTTPENKTIQLTFTGPKRSVIMKHSTGEQNELPINDLPNIMKTLGMEETLKKMVAAYVLQVNELANSRQSVIFPAIKAGYRQAKEQKKSKKILDMASKYAVVAYTSQQAYSAQHNGDLTGYKVMPICETGVIPTDKNCTVNGATYNTAVIQQNFVTIKINFDNQKTCQAVAKQAAVADITCKPDSAYIDFTVNMN